jgi:hypothetical protein
LAIAPVAVRARATSANALRRDAGLANFAKPTCTEGPRTCGERRSSN